jgi:nucleotide-binding universal stress UspA family protein
MPNIVSLIDGSEYSDSICELSAWFAKRLDASIDVVHVLGRRDVSENASNLSGSIGLGARSSLLEELSELDAKKAKLVAQRGRELLENAQAYLTNAGVEQVSTKLRNAEIIETIADYESTTDLIVLGKRGMGADYDKMHLGSNLERVARSSQKPVLVASRVIRPIKRFMIAFDGGNSVWKAIEYACSNSNFTDLHCSLITVGENNSNAAGLERAAKTLRDAGYEVEAEVVSGEPESAIAAKVESADIHLLLMGAYGHSRIRNLIIGSTTTEMLRSCKIPVLLFR